jgi:hypothetical protein
MRTVIAMPDPLPARRALLAAATAVLAATGCGSSDPSPVTELIYLNGNRVSGVSIQVTPPSAAPVTLSLPTADVPGEAFGPAVRKSYEVAVGDVFGFTATAGPQSTTVSCTVTEQMIPVAGDDATGFAVVGVYVDASQQAPIDLLCNW